MTVNQSRKRTIIKRTTLTYDETSAEHSYYLGVIQFCLPNILNVFLYTCLEFHTKTHFPEFPLVFQ